MNKHLILLALPLLAACVTNAAAPAEIKGTKWAFTAIDGKAPVSSRAALTIDADRVGANVGCNGMGGDLQIKGDRLVTGGIMSTMMYCDGVMDQESAVGALLEADPVYTVKGDRMTLKGGGHSAELRRLP